MSFRLLEAVKSKLLQCNDSVLRKNFLIPLFSMGHLTQKLFLIHRDNS